MSNENTNGTRRGTETRHGFETRRDGGAGRGTETRRGTGTSATDARRRTFLRSVAVAGTALGTAGVAAAAPSRGGGFPPKGTTEWSDPVTLGNGELRTFTTATPSGQPKYHGVYLDRDVLEGLPSAAELAAWGESDDPGDKFGDHGEAAEIHGKWSQQFFVPFPGTDATPFTFLGFNWNPGGHPPPGVYTVPHFDVHFHTQPAAAVDAIEGPRVAEFDLPPERRPEGYVRLPEIDGQPAVVTDMGEHLGDPTAPELNGGEFTNTLIWGAYDTDGDGVGELTFVEPMVTKAYLEDLTGTDTRDIAQPATFAEPRTNPTTYTVRDVPSDDAVAITVEEFVEG